MSMYQPYSPPTTSPPGQPGQPGQMAYAQAPVPGPVAPYPYPYPVALPPHPQATTVLVLGILSLVVAGLLGPVAWGIGNKARRECAAGQYQMTDSLRIGRILGIIASVLLIAGVAITVLLVIVFVVFAAANS